MVTPVFEPEDPLLIGLYIGTVVDLHLYLVSSVRFLRDTALNSALCQP